MADGYIERIERWALSHPGNICETKIHKFINDMKQGQLRMIRIFVLAILPLLFCGCQPYSRQEISDIPSSINGIIMVHRNASEEELKMYAETAIELYNKGKIICLVIVAEHDEADRIDFYLGESDLRNNVALNMEPGRPIKVLSGIGDVLGYNNSYTIISKHHLYRLKQIYF